jgi:hypothetical protein
LGGTDEVSTVFGSSALQPTSGSMQRAAGGLFALPSNSGEFRKDAFAVVPEIEVKAGVLLAPWCRATLGYDFLYWSRVLRPGNQIDQNIDLRQVPTAPSFSANVSSTFPRATEKQGSFWAQGVTFGLEFVY